jgi:hypothetical protein
LCTGSAQGSGLLAAVWGVAANAIALSCVQQSGFGSRI